jgi:hypothetical protein
MIAVHKVGKMSGNTGHQCLGAQSAKGYWQSTEGQMQALC